jgi:hypothetical protein
VRSVNCDGATCDNNILAFVRGIIFAENETIAEYGGPTKLATPGVETKRSNETDRTESDTRRPKGASTE